MVNLKQETVVHKSGEVFEVWKAAGVLRCLHIAKNKKRRRAEGEDIASIQCEKRGVKNLKSAACHWHGKNAVKGADHPNAKTLKRSGYPLNGLGDLYTQHLKGKRKQIFQESLAQTDLSLVPDIKVLQTMILELLGNGPSQEEMFSTLGEIATESQKALDAAFSNDAKVMVAAIKQIQALASITQAGGGNDKKVRKLIDEKSKAVATEVKNVTSMQTTMQMSVVNLMFASVLQALGYRLMENIQDKKLIASIMRETKKNIGQFLPVYSEEE
jgi:hypothetical protein